jgi:hypothetical protein
MIVKIKKKKMKVKVEMRENKENKKRKKEDVLSIIKNMIMKKLVRKKNRKVRVRR